MREAEGGLKLVGLRWGQGGGVVWAPVHMGEIVSGGDDAAGLLWLDKKFLLNDELAIDEDRWGGGGLTSIRAS